MTLVFKPRFGWGRQWRLVVGALAIAANFFFFRGEANTVAWQIVLFIVGLGLLNELRILISLHYTISGDALIVAAWPFRWRYRLESMTRVRQGERWWNVRMGEDSLRKNLTLSARDLAFYRDYLVVEFRDGRVTRISPTDKEGFVMALRERAPHVAFEGLG